MARNFIPLQVRFYDEALLNRVRAIAQYENRSMNAQILEFIKQGVEEYIMKQEQQGSNLKDIPPTVLKKGQ